MAYRLLKRAFEAEIFGNTYRIEPQQARVGDAQIFTVWKLVSGNWEHFGAITVSGSYITKNGAISQLKRSL